MRCSPPREIHEPTRDPNFCKYKTKHRGTVAVATCCSSTYSKLATYLPFFVDSLVRASYRLQMHHWLEHPHSLHLLGKNTTHLLVTACGVATVFLRRGQLCVRCAYSFTHSYNRNLDQYYHHTYQANKSSTEKSLFRAAELRNFFTTTAKKL